MNAAIPTGLVFQNRMILKEKIKAEGIKQMFAVVLLGVAVKLIWKPDI